MSPQVSNSAPANPSACAVSPARRWLVAGSWTAFVVALLFYAGSVLRVDPMRTELTNLDPRPDAVEYFALARSLLSTGAAEIRIGDEILPSRYPVGFPVLMLPWLAALPEAQALAAPVRTNQTLGLLLLVVVFAWLHRNGRSGSAGFVVLLLATIPSFTALARSTHSDLSGAVFVVFAFLLIAGGLRTNRSGPIFLAAALLGLALNIRLQLIFFAPVLLAMALLPRTGSWAGWFARCAACLAVYLVCTLPTFILNFATFGHPLETGYHFWVPGATGAGRTFNLQFVAPNLRLLWQEFTLTWSGFRSANLSGGGAYFLPTFIVLAVLGALRLRPSRLLLCGGLAVGVFSIGALTYFFLDVRLYFPLLALAPLAMNGLIEDWARPPTLGARFARAKNVVVAALVALSVVGVPSIAGYPDLRFTTQSLHALRWPTKRYPGWNERILTRFLHAPEVAPGVVLSDLSPVYLNALLPAGYAAAPVDERHDYQGTPRWHYDGHSAARLVQAAWQKHQPIYAIALTQAEAESLIARLPRIDGTEWRVFLPADPLAPGVVLRLSRSRADE